ncbi:TlpA family protein disulfide reductase [Photobacterium alginatilyticum]|uniref:TlpA family protein disulfide reductase n=1 Tax=Photobacterium alginatilyticum TaxID=1775171 RepID=A0ABW9YP83_9GAMM|nr:TlpA disulfide reductase family protein [Photobacterium alginatilyticum]NBI55520.1 TlpA family protein disulfide reductase [Photobacterium alginatilyticum]
MNNFKQAVLINLALIVSIPAYASNCSTPQGFEQSHAPYTLTELTAPVSLVNLWAVWCPPCLKELPALNSIATSKHFRVETVHIGDNQAAIDSRFEQLKIQRLPKTIEPDISTINKLGFQGLPATLVVVDGVVKYRYSGYIKHEPEVIERWLTCLSGEL